MAKALPEAGSPDSNIDIGLPSPLLTAMEANHPERFKRYKATPVDTAALSTIERPDYPSVIDGYHALSPHAGFNQFMPAASPAVLAQISQATKAPMPSYMGMTGRVVDLAVETGQRLGGGPEKRQELSIVDADYAPGRLWLEAQILESEARGEYTSVMAFSGKVAAGASAFLVFIADEHSPHPLTKAEEGEELPVIGNWRGGGMITTADALPNDGYVSEPLGPGEQPHRTLLSLEAAKYVKQFYDNQKNEGRDPNKVIDLFMSAMYTHLMRPEGKDYDPISDPKLPDSVKKLIHNYLTGSSSLMQWRIPVRGWTEMLELEAFTKRHPKLSSQSRERITTRQHAIRAEVIQAIGMRKVSSLYEQTARIDAAMPQGSANAVRCTLGILDPWDKEFAAKVLGKLTGHYRADGAKIAADIASLPPNTSLLIQPTMNNILTRHELNSGGSQPTHQGAFYYAGNSQPFSSMEGPMVRDINYSFYAGQLKADGVVGVFDTFDAKRGTPVDRFLVIDLMQAPGKILRRVVELGLLDTSAKDLEIGNFPTLNELLTAEPKPYYLLVEHGDRPKIKGIIPRDSGMLVVRQPNKVSQFPTRSVRTAQLTTGASKKRLSIRTERRQERAMRRSERRVKAGGILQRTPQQSRVRQVVLADGGKVPQDGKVVLGFFTHGKHGATAVYAPRVSQHSSTHVMPTII